jgi:hypothetical protein
VIGARADDVLRLRYAAAFGSGARRNDARCGAITPATADPCQM